MSEKYDDHLSFTLPYGYEANTGINDEGNRYFHILCGTGINDDGETTSELKVMLRRLDGQLDEEKANLQGDLPAVDLGKTAEMSLGIQLGSSARTSNRSLVIQILIYVVAVGGDDGIYTLIATKPGREEAFDENTELIARHMNRILGCMTLDGKSAGVEQITAQRVGRTIHLGGASEDGSLGGDLVKPKTTEPTEAVPQKTPEELAAEMAQAEEAARRKAEEEEAKRKAEAEAAEKLRQDKAEYETAHREWEAECRRIEGQRQSHIADQKAKRRNELEAAAEKTCADKLAALDETEKKLKAELAETESALASLGFFKFGEKKAAKEKIERLNSALSKASSDRAAAEQAKTAAIAAIDRTLSSEKDAMTRRAESAYPKPKEPQKPASILEDEAAKEKERFAGMTPAQQKNEMLKDAIVAYLRDSEPMTISDMIESIPELWGESNQSVSALCRALTLSGKIEKYIDKRRTYFRIPW